MEALNLFNDKLQSDDIAAISKIRNVVLRSLQQYAQDAGFNQMMPILMSPITDPLNHAVYPAEISYEQTKLKLTASMIFHKQLMLHAKNIDKIFILAPNIRLEKNTVKESANHLLEFSQFDLEIKGASMHDIMAFLEGLYKHVFAAVKAECADVLAQLGRDLPDYDKPFPIYSSDELIAKYGDEFEAVVSKNSDSPVFITNYKREFYDRETPGVRGQYNNFDIIYPEGYGEGLSGAEREFEHDQLVYRMEELDMDLTPYTNYLAASKRHMIPPTAGAGIGIERLLKFICGKTQIKDIQLFDRSISSDFLF